jgi:hypothetical protein
VILHWLCPIQSRWLDAAGLFSENTLRLYRRLLFLHRFTTTSLHSIWRWAFGSWITRIVNLRALIGRFNLALKFQFRASSVFSFPIYSICRYPSLGILYGSYFRLIQFADSCSVVIGAPYISTKVIAIQLLIARPNLTVELKSCILAVEFWSCSLLFDLSVSTSQHLSRQGSLYLAWPVHTVSVDLCILVYAHTYRCPGILAVRTTALWENRKIVWSLWGLFSVCAPTSNPESAITHPT